MAARVTPAGNQVDGQPIPTAFGNGVAGGRIGYNSTTTAQAVSVETDLTTLSVTVTVNANRCIRVEGYVPIGGFGAGSADERSYVRIKEGSTEMTGDAVFERISSGSLINGVARPCAISGTSNFATPTAGSHTYKLTLEGLTTANATTAATTAPATTRPAWIAVWDDGPAF